MKLHILRKIKKSFQYEKYLSIVKSSKYRRALTSLRIASHKLEIETGRWTRKENGDKLDRSERFCNFCKENGDETVGDEIHAVIQCKTFECERNILFQKVNEKIPLFDTLNDKNKLLFLLSMENNLIINVAKFIHKVLSVKRETPGILKTIGKKRKKRKCNKKTPRVIPIS